MDIFSKKIISSTIHKNSKAYKLAKLNEHGIIIPLLVIAKEVKKTKEYLKNSDLKKEVDILIQNSETIIY